MTFFSGRRQPESDTHQDVSVGPVIPPQPVGFETVLGAGSSFEGQFTSTGNVRIDGTFTGTLEINGNILVGETARINADIHARNISIAGGVRGNVFGNKVQLLRTGRIWGDISAKALSTEEGAFIDGKITMSDHEVNQSTASTEPARPADEPAPILTGEEVVEPVEVSADDVSNDDVSNKEDEE